MNNDEIELKLICCYIKKFKFFAKLRGISNGGSDHNLTLLFYTYGKIFGKSFIPQKIFKLKKISLFGTIFFVLSQKDFRTILFLFVQKDFIKCPLIIK